MAGGEAICHFCFPTWVHVDLPCELYNIIARNWQPRLNVNHSHSFFFPCNDLQNPGEPRRH